MRPNLQRIAAGAIGKTLTPQQKSVIVNQKLGNTSIKNQQGTSRVLYDSLPLDGRLNFNFFDSVQTRAFPLTNINQNKLQVGETFVLQRVYFCVVIVAAGTTNVTNVQTLAAAALTGLYGGDFTVNFDTSTVLKPYPLSTQLSQFNFMARHTTNEWIKLDSELVIPTDIQFVCALRETSYTALANAFLRCVWQGFGTLLSPKTQF